MPDAKIRSLKVRPLRSADLSLNMPGILATRTPLALLGKRITLTNPEGNPAGAPFDMKGDVYDKFGLALPNGSMMMSPGAIGAALNPHALFVLRNESLRVSLEQLVLQRQNAFLERYKHDVQRLAFVRDLFPTSLGDPTGQNTPGSKLFRLLQLKIDHQNRHDQLHTAYTGGAGPDGIDRSGIVKQQNTDHDNSVLYTGANTVVSTTKVHPTESKQFGYTTTVSGGVSQTIATPDVIMKPVKYGDSSTALTDPYEASVTDTVYPSGQGTTLDQTSKSFLTDYAFPTLDNHIRNNRTQVDLLDEILGNSTYALRVLELAQIWKNELAMLDAEVAKLQFNYAHTFLVSPMPGIVTAVYKNAGESVQAGEPIVRVEDDEVILLVGSILCRSGVRLDDKVKVIIDNLFENGVPVQIDDGRIVAVRGHDSDNDEWEVIIEIKNPQSGNRRLLPLNYTFDRDDTRLVLS